MLPHLRSLAQDSWAGGLTYWQAETCGISQKSSGKKIETDYPQFSLSIWPYLSVWKSISTANGMFYSAKLVEMSGFG